MCTWQKRSYKTQPKYISVQIPTLHFHIVYAKLHLCNSSIAIVLFREIITTFYYNFNVPCCTHGMHLHITPLSGALHFIKCEQMITCTIYLSFIYFVFKYIIICRVSLQCYYVFILLFFFIVFLYIFNCSIFTQYCRKIYSRIILKQMPFRKLLHIFHRITMEYL